MSYPPITLATPTNPSFVAVDSSFVYWADGENRVMRVPIGGGTQETIASGQTGAAPVTLDSANVYWGTYSSAGTIVRSQK